MIVVHSVGDVAVRAGYILETRSLEDFELVYFPAGTESFYEIGSRSIRLNMPCVVFTRPGEPHRYRFDRVQNVRHLYVHFDCMSLRAGDSRWSALHGNCHMLPVTDTLLPELMTHMLRIANEQPAHWRSRLSALLAAAIEELCAWAEQGPSFPGPGLPLPVEQAIAYMDERLAEPITIEEIASRSGWSHEHFTRTFVASTGITPKRALLERRLKQAERLMMTGGLSVKQIAFEVGFRDEHHFSKMYKQIRGISASEYIKQCRNPIFRHTAFHVDAKTPYPINCHIVVNNDIK